MDRRKFLNVMAMAAAKKVSAAGLTFQLVDEKHTTEGHGANIGKKILRKAGGNFYQRQCKCRPNPSTPLSQRF